MIRWLNLDSPAQIPLALDIARRYPKQKLTFGYVIDPEVSAREALKHVSRLAKVAHVIPRPFDSYGLMIRDKRGRPLRPRYTMDSYRERAFSCCVVLGSYSEAIEFGNELSPHDTAWIPRGTEKCVAVALEVARAKRVRSLVTWFAWRGMEAWMMENPLRPDDAGVSFYPHAVEESITVVEALCAVQRACGDVPKYISEYGSQDGDGVMTVTIEKTMIPDLEQSIRLPSLLKNYRGACSWNALEIWPDVESIYDRLWK